MKHWRKKYKLTRGQKIVRNILLSIFAAVILFFNYFSGYAPTEEQALQEVLWRMGASKHDIILRQEWKYEGKDMWSEYFLLSEVGVHPVTVNIKIHRNGPLQYYGAYPELNLYQ